MAVIKLVIDDLDEADFDLIALHSTFDNYRIAFAINTLFPVYLVRQPEPKTLYLKNEKAQFDFYQFKDEADDHGHYWELLNNKGQFVDKPTDLAAPSGLFDELEADHSTYILPEIKQADFILKLNHALDDPDTIASVLNASPLIQKAYVIDFDKVKSYQNLIE